MSADEEGRVRPLEHVLFRALTRPALFMGVPIEAAGASLVGGQLVALASGRQWMMLVGGCGLWLVAAGLSRRDPLMFRVIVAWLNTRPQHWDLGAASRRHWGGLSMSVLRVSARSKMADLGRNWSPLCARDAGGADVGHG